MLLANANLNDAQHVSILASVWTRGQIDHERSNDDFFRDILYKNVAFLLRKWDNNASTGSSLDDIRQANPVHMKGQQGGK